MKRTILLLLCLWSLGSQAQTRLGNLLNDKDNDPRISALPYYNYGQGLGMTSADSLFQFNIRFRIQNRAEYSENNNGQASIDGQIRRLRLRFDGYVGHPNFLYVIQLSFAPGDVGEIEEGLNLNIIRDAVFVYRANKHLSFTFGQTKLPGNRQRVNSSGALQLTDRTINNAQFNIDRDFGLQASYLLGRKDAFSFNLFGAISNGEGRNWTQTHNTHLAYTGKLELFPLGSFTKNGSYFEGDVLRETKPKLMLSAAFSHNEKAKRAAGQLGDLLYQDRTMQSFFADAVFKYQGLAFMWAYMSRQAESPITTNEAGNRSYVVVGHGMDYQLSYNFGPALELIGRFSTQDLEQSIRTLRPNARQYSIGLTKYFREHSFKLQSEFTYNELLYHDGSTKNNWYARAQVEIGI